MGIFGNKKDEDIFEEDLNINTSKFGRNVTSIESAKQELFTKVERINPIPYINESVKLNKNFYGHIHYGKDKGKPFLIDEDEVTMEIYVGSTGKL